MNFNKHTFTKEQFLALPVFETVREAPVGEPFLLKGIQSHQQEYLMDLIEKHGDKLPAIVEQGPEKSLKVVFWSKYKDGNVRDNGGKIIFPKAEVKQTGDRLVITTGEDAKITVG